MLINILNPMKHAKTKKVISYQYYMAVGIPLEEIWRIKFRILLNSDSSSTIVMVKLMSNSIHKKFHNNMKDLGQKLHHQQRHQHIFLAAKIKRNKNSVIEIFMCMTPLKVGNTILGRYPLTALGLETKFFNHTILGDVGP